MGNVDCKYNKAHLKEANDIYKTLPDQQKRFVAGNPGNPTPKQMFTQDEAEGIAYYVLKKTGNTPVGYLAAIDQSWRGKGDYADVVLVTRSGYQQMGIGKEMVEDLLKWFADSPLDSLHWNAEEENIGSNKLAEKMGFKPNKEQRFEGVIERSKHK